MSKVTNFIKNHISDILTGAAIFSIGGVAALGCKLGFKACESSYFKIIADKDITKKALQKNINKLLAPVKWAIVGSSVLTAGALITTFDEGCEIGYKKGKSETCNELYKIICDVEKIDDILVNKLGCLAKDYTMYDAVEDWKVYSKAFHDCEWAEINEKNVKECLDKGLFINIKAEVVTEE